MEFHTVTICGLERKLPIKAVGKNTKLANFKLLGDVELVEAVAGKLYEILRTYEFDVIVGPESKVMPLLHELAKRFGHTDYVVCRKSVKPYMISPLILDPQPHFPRHVKRLVIDGNDAELIKGKNVAIVDDVVSTGVTMRMVKRLMKLADAHVSVIATVLRQGETSFENTDDYVFLETLPIFKE
jgi:adenine phosphoribosyltransferase